MKEKNLRFFSFISYKSCYSDALTIEDDGAIVAFDGVAAALVALTGVAVAVTVSVGVGVMLEVPDDELLGTSVSYSNCIVVPCVVSVFVESIRLIFVLVAAYCMAAVTPLFASV